MMDYYDILKKYRKKKIASLEDLQGKPKFRSTQYGKNDVKKLIPHRDPFLLVDKILGVDLTEGEELIIGTRFIAESEEVFRGHFPEYPLYPGSLQLEMGGQMGLCLTHFVVNQTYAVDENTRPVQVRATKVLGALFLEPVLPNREVTIISRRLEYDGFFGTVLSQIISDEKIGSVSIAEVIFLNE